ncbi:Flp pilus assembly protein TadD [Candidatus Electrothrix aarhusensis]|uniref:Flp pilus assembly protein TadD n=1 Tax=Candidatus Electrothrix aarhusensis TaxID=1859131 RepID=A0A444ITE4_9BACT|nr:Flp pilus assembly protein TadD [Candidatus Electrothrix aarhusensis]
MFFNNPVYDQGFQADDGLILAQPLLLELEEILPIPASTGFWLHDPACPSEHAFSSKQLKRLHAWQEEVDEETANTPVVLEDMLVIPLITAQMIDVTLVIYDVDPAVLQKMATEWLIELQEKILQRFCRIRHIYIEPDTGLYNRRALTLLLAKESCRKTLFLIAAVPGTRTLAGGFQKICQVNALLPTLIDEPLFYLGQGLFAAVRSINQRSTCLDFSHRLISRLKREGLRKVHVGFSSLPPEDTPQEILHRCQRLLAEAERRGPYSLCDEAFLVRKEQHPFALPAAPVLRRLQKKWRGLDRFGLLLVSFAHKQDKQNKQDGKDKKKAQELPDLDSILAKSQSSSTFYTSYSLNASEQLILLPDLSFEQTSLQAKQLAQEISKKRDSDALPYIGFCHSPTVSVPKIECIRSCRKAILHASFYEKGAVVAFDALSYNVSGDLYFDEGDYKQAIREYKAGLQIKPDDVNLLNSLGVALAEINRHREAEACFSKVLQTEPQNYMALINKGMSCRLLGRSKEAIACFEQGLRCKEHAKQASIELYLQLGKLYCLQEEFEKAATLLKEWKELKGEPSEFIFFRLLGEASMGAGENNEAIKALQRSLQIYPQNADSQSMLGLLYVLEGQGAEVGLSLCDRAITSDSGDARHLHRRAAALRHLERLNEALDDVRESLRIQRNNEQTLLLRAILYEELGSLRRAQQGFQRIISMKKSTENRKKEALAGLVRIAARTRISSQS